MHANRIEEKYGVKRKGLTTVIEELKQRILAKSISIRTKDPTVQD